MERVLQGGLGNQSTLTFGSPDDVRKQTRRLLDVMGAGGGDFFASAKPPDGGVPIEDVTACLEELEEPRSPSG